MFSFGLLECLEFLEFFEFLDFLELGDGVFRFEIFGILKLLALGDGVFGFWNFWMFPFPKILESFKFFGIWNCQDPDCLLLHCTTTPLER